MKLTAGQWNVLAHTATYGTTSSDDFAPSPRRNGGMWTKDGLKKLRSYQERTGALVEAGLVSVECQLTGEVKITDAGIAALVEAGYAKNSTGCWLHPNKKAPGWAL